MTKTWHVVTPPTSEAIGSLPLAIGAPQFFGRDQVVAARLNLPAVGSGACDNVDAVYDGEGGFVISTGVARTAPDTALHRLG